MRIGSNRSTIKFMFVLVMVVGLALAGCVPIQPPAAPEASAAPAATTEQDLASGDRYSVTGVDYLGEVTFPTGTMFQETEVGGLSGVAYDAANQVYYLISDDRSQTAPARFYVASIDLADGALDEGDVVFENVVTLMNGEGQPYAENSLDPESIALTSEGTLFISSEGNAGLQPPIAPFVDEFALDGTHLRSMPIPDKYLPDGTGAIGVRNNAAFESLTVTPDGRYLVTAVEDALAQDGPTADLEQGSLSRVLVMDTSSGEAVHEMVYTVDAVPVPADPNTGSINNGLAEMVALDTNGTYLALERSFSEGVGNTISLYQARAQGALDVITNDALFLTDQDVLVVMDPPIAKDLLVNMANLGVTPDNLEGMTLGPVLPDGRQTLIIVSDNNFNETQTTQVIALALTLQRVPVAAPVLETQYTVDSDEGPEGSFMGDSDDPAIWINPTDPAESRVYCTLKDGGFVAFNLAGEVVQHFAPEEYGAIRYNNGDLIYGFDLDGESVDLIVFSDRQNDTVAIYQIDAESGELTDITADSNVESIFGVDDGEVTAYGLATYKSPTTGAAYAFVTQAGGNLVAQVELASNGSGQVPATVVRTLELPLEEVGEEPDAMQSEGMAVDGELGFMYVATEDGRNIYKFAAEPDGGDEPLSIISNDALKADVEGVIIYYGADGSGYLLVSSQGDSTYAVFDRQGENAYVGSFAVGDSGDIDQANESDGAEVTNVSLGTAFPSGLLVVQDGANDPQFAVVDEEELENSSTNFKFVPWEEVANAFDPPLLIDTEGYSPR